MGYYEISNAFLEHHSCCLRLTAVEAMFLLHLLKYRSLTLAQRQKARDAGVDASDYESGHGWPGNKELARYIGCDPSYVPAMARRLEGKGLLKRIARKTADGTRNRSNQWDVTPMINVLDAHMRDASHAPRKAIRGEAPPSCPCWVKPARERRSKADKAQIRRMLFKEGRSADEVSRQLGIPLKDVKIIETTTKRRTDADLWG